MHDFRQQIEQKYKGQEMISSRNEPIIVKAISDLNFYNLSTEDQEAAVLNDWAFGWQDYVTEQDFIWRGTLMRPIAREFLLSPKPFLLFVGGLGCAKTRTLCESIVMGCFKNPGMHWGLFRETIGQIKSTTLKVLLYECFENLGLQEKTDWEHVKDKTNPHIKLHIEEGVASDIYYKPYKQGATDLEKMRGDLKSLPVDAIAVDEPNTMHYEVYKMLQGRRGRWGGKDETLQVRMAGNPPAEHHWLCQLFMHKKHPYTGVPIGDPNRYGFWIAPTYDNRDGILQSYIRDLELSDPEFQRTFLYGLPGYLEHSGSPCYTTYFTEEQHLERGGMPFYPNEPLLIGIDIGPTASFKAAIISQMDKDNCLNVLHEIVTKEPGIIPFARRLKQLITTTYPTTKPHVIVCDPDAWKTAETDISSPASLMFQMGFPMQQGPVTLQPRMDAVVQLLQRQGLNGKSGFRIRYHGCPHLIQGFLGGYHWKNMSESEGMLSKEPEKNIFSHPHDALQYLCAHLVGFRYEEILAEERRRTAAQAAAMGFVLENQDIPDYTVNPEFQGIILGEKGRRSPAGRYTGTRITPGYYAQNRRY